MRRNLLLLVSVMLWLVGSAVAFAAVIDGDDRDNNLRSTPKADAMRGLGGRDNMSGSGGPHRFSGGVTLGTIGPGRL